MYFESLVGGKYLPHISDLYRLFSETFIKFNDNFTSKMKLDIFKNKKTDQNLIFLRKKEMNIMGVDGAIAVKLSKSNFIFKNDKRKK